MICYILSGDNSTVSLSCFNSLMIALLKHMILLCGLEICSTIAQLYCQSLDHDPIESLLDKSVLRLRERHQRFTTITEPFYIFHVDWKIIFSKIHFKLSVNIPTETEDIITIHGVLLIY